LLALGRVSARGDGARGIVGRRIVGRRDLGFACKVTTLGHVGSEFDGRHHKSIIDASGLSDEGHDKKGDPVEEKDKPAEPRKGLEGLVLMAEAFPGGWFDWLIDPV
jgi:hypothetical protein